MKNKLIIAGILLLNAFLVSGQTDTAGKQMQKYYYPGGALSSEGYLTDGKPDGYWKTFHENGKLKSEGNRLSFELDSIWRFYSEEGNLVLEVNYKKGKKNGLRKTFREGELMTETFLNDVKNGLTTYYYPDGKKKLVVNFVNGFEQGYAREYDQTGNIISITEYKKGFVVSRENINRKDKEGRKQGNWKFFRENGMLVQEGTYKNDLKHGYFKDYGPDGKLVQIRKYEDDVLIENAEEVIKLETLADYHPNGKVKISATYRSGVPEGIRREYDETGKVIKGAVFRKGIKIADGITDDQGFRQGPWKEFYDDGKTKSEGNYLNGKQVGLWKYFYQNGKIENTGSFNKAGKTEGEWKWYYDDGSIRREESFSNGLSDATMTEYDENGKIIAQGEYVDGREQGKWMYQYGDIKEEGNYQEGSRDGVWKTWYANGQLLFEGKYVEDVPDGRHTYYWENGKKKDEGIWVMGKKEGEWYKFDNEGNIFIVISYSNGIEKRYDGVKVTPEQTEED
jgi:antitoxin component YwqK of YwqJK toxin-antitoxin module